MLNSLLGQLSAQEKSFSSNHISSKHLGALIDLVTEKKITQASGKILLRHILGSPSSLSSSSVEQVALELNLIASNPSADSTNSGDLTVVCQQAIDAMPTEVASFRTGNHNVVNRLVGKVMRDTRGRSDANAAKERILLLLQD